MLEVYGVTFKPNGKVYYFLPNGLKINIKTYVIVETERGLQFGMLATNKKTISEDKVSTPLRNIVRIATNADIKKNTKNITDAKNSLNQIRKIVSNNKLDMQIIDADYTFDRSQLMIKFLADARVDFRKLAKELATVYKTRIELRQIGARDKAKEIGGLGLCGRQLCCSYFLDDLDSVSINMAKNQNISLNPNKINGCCGRLLCCLKYENECYLKCRKNLPLVGKKIITEDGEGKVVSLDILKRKYSVEYPSKGIVEYSLNEED